MGLCAWSNPLNIRIGSPDPYLAIRSGPSISANASGTYTYYIRENDTTVPSHPDPVSMTISGTAMGLGWIDFKITAITINGANHLEDPQYGEAPTEDIGYMAVMAGVPLYARAENDDFSFTVEKASAWSATPGTYDWGASGQALRKLARWDGGQWVVHNDTSDPSYTHTTTNDGSWTVTKTNVCSFCKQAGVSSPTEHYVNPCPNAGCQEGGWYWNCYGVPSSHAYLATCSNCNVSSVYACSGHPNNCTSGSGNQGSSGSDNTPNCSYCTDGCSSCQNNNDDDTVVPPPPPPPPPDPVACPADRWTDCGGTDPNEHSSSPCSAGHTYWTCNPSVNVSNWENKHKTRTCRFSGCSNSWQACVNGWTPPLCNNPYRNRNGYNCGAQ